MEKTHKNWESWNLVICESLILESHFAADLWWVPPQSISESAANLECYPGVTVLHSDGATHASATTGARLMTHNFCLGVIKLLDL